MASRAVIYTRISLDRDGKEAGVARQLAACRELAERERWEVVGTYQDNDRSAYSRKPRPDFERMMADAATGTFDVILVWSVDRLYRRLTELERIVTILNGVRATVATVKSGDVDLATADGRAVARILGSLSQRESEKLGERVSERAFQRATVEKKATSGRRPFGWNFDGTMREEEASAISDAFSMLLEGLSVSAIARELTARGLVASEGGPITQARVSTWLRAPRHAGIVTYRGKPVGEVGGIIDRATWDRAQALLSDPARAPRKGRPHSTLLGGLLSCGTCGASLRPSSNSVNRGERILTYACEPHRHVNRSREMLDLFVREAVAVYLSDNSAMLAERMTAADGSAPLLAQIAHLEKQLESLSDLMASGSLDAVDFTAASTKARARIKALESERQRVSGMVATGRVMEAEDVAVAVHGLDRSRFRSVLAELVDRVEVPAGGGFAMITWR